MENLPDHVIRNIVKYLSVKDLGACCSTSTSWRVVFNQDHVWMPFCDQLLAAHLKVTKCQVEPGFVSPETEDSSLSPICDWRLSYMREVHLWNNWIQRRCQREFIGCFVFSLFLNSNLILIQLSREKRVMLWDVQETLTHLCDPVTLKFDSRIEFCKIIEDDIIFVQKGTIQKYKINQCTTASWELQGIYNLSSPVYGHIIWMATHILFVWNRNDVLEIFDMKSCASVNIINISNELTKSNVYSVENGGISSMHCIVVLKCRTCEEQESDNSEAKLVWKKSQIIHIYNIEKQNFIDFKVTIPMNTDDYPCSCYIDEEFLTVFNNGSIKVFKYLTSELILDAPYAFTSSIRSLVFTDFEYPDLILFSRDDIDRFNGGEFSVFFINSHLSSSLSPVCCRCWRLKSYDIAKLLQHVKKYLTLPAEVADVAQYAYSNLTPITNNIYTKCIIKNGTFVATFW